MEVVTQLQLLLINRIFFVRREMAKLILMFLGSQQTMMDIRYLSARMSQAVVAPVHHGRTEGCEALQGRAYAPWPYPSYRARSKLLYHL